MSDEMYVNGEMYDLRNAGDRLKLEMLREEHKGKTAWEIMIAEGAIGIFVNRELIDMVCPDTARRLANGLMTSADEAEKLKREGQ